MSDASTKNMHHVTVHKPKKQWYKKWWVWVIAVVVLLVIAGASGGSQKKTSTNKNTNNAPAASAPVKWDVQAAYDKVQTGMTKQQVEAATGKTSSNCTASAIQGAGNYETCNYGGGFSDKGTIIVTYTDGAVSSKTKSTY